MRMRDMRSQLRLHLHPLPGSFARCTAEIGTGAQGDMMSRHAASHNVTTTGRTRLECTICTLHFGQRGSLCKVNPHASAFGIQNRQKDEKEKALWPNGPEAIRVTTVQC